MYIAAFIFQPGNFDERYFALDALIQQAAEATPGYIGQESWKSPNGETVKSTYYWQSLEALQAFSSRPKHLEAKRQYQQWYKGFHIVISQVIKSYGDGVLAHFTSNDRVRLS